MDSVNAGSGGGIHPGAPIIWPTIKPTTTTESTTESQSQSQSSSSASSSSASASAASSSSSSASASSASAALSQAASASAAAASSANMSRSLSTQDISTQLMSINMADTPENQALASKMLEYGLELSPENFTQLFQSLQSKTSNQTSQTAAFTALAKGVADNPAAMGALEQVFSGQNDLSDQLHQLQQGMAQTQAALKGQGSINPALANRLSSLLSEFDSRIKKMQNQESTPRTAMPSKTEMAMLQNVMNSKAQQLSPGQQSVLSQVMNKQPMASGSDISHLQSLLTNGSLSKEEQSMLSQFLGASPLKAAPSKADMAMLQNIMNTKSQQFPAEQRLALGQLMDDHPNMSAQDAMHLQSLLSGGALSKDEKSMLSQLVARGQASQMDQSSQRTQDVKMLKSLGSSIQQQIEKTGDPSQKKILMSTMAALQNVIDIKSQQMSPGQQTVAGQPMNKQSMMSEAEMAQLQSLLSGNVLSEEEKNVLSQLVSRGQVPRIEEGRQLLQDLNALKSLIEGVRQQISKSGSPEEKHELMQTLKELEAQMGEVIENVAGQSILSKLSKYDDPKLPDKYYYWMIPNPFSEKSKNIEILIKRDPTKKDAPVNPDKTQIIMKVETETFGDIAVIVEITGKDVWYLFNTPNEDARHYIAANAAMLRQQTSNLDFQVKGFQAQVKKIEINKILSPTLDLDHMKRIRTEA